MKPVLKISALAGVACLACGGLAHADEGAPDPAATAAGDANLESTARRKGMSVTFAAGGGLTFGLGIADSVGRGGAAALRLGHVATPRTVLTLELVGVALFHAVQTTSGMTERRTNRDSNLLVGGQYFVNSALWVRGAVGLGVYRADSVADDTTLIGPAGALGAGVDVLRWKRVALGLEIMSIGMLNKDGVLSSNAVMLNASVE